MVRPHSRALPCSASLALLVLPACGTYHRWQEIETAPMPQAELFDAIEYIAVKNGYTPDIGECDRGLGHYQSRWRQSHQWVGRPVRYRLMVDVDYENLLPNDGYLVRYAVERQKIGNPARSMDPREEDWSNDGQEAEAEYLFGTSLQLRLTGKVEGMRVGPDEGGATGAVAR